MHAYSRRALKLCSSQGHPPAGSIRLHLQGDDSDITMQYSLAVKARHLPQTLGQPASFLLSMHVGFSATLLLTGYITNAEHSCCLANCFNKAA